MVLNWSEIPELLHRKLIIGGSGSGKTNPLFILMSRETDDDKIYLYVCQGPK